MNTLTPKSLIKNIILGLLLLVAVIAVCVFIGSATISPSQLWQAFLSKDTDNIDYKIFFGLRLPRCILAGLVGAALAMSGAVLQALLRNPLADPYILGISSGAGLGAMIATICGLQFSFLGIGTMGLFAFLGAIATVWFVWWIGILVGSKNITGLLLAGVVVNAFISAVIMFLTSIMRSSALQATMIWTMGNIRDAQLGDIIISSVCLAIAIILLFRLSPMLNILSFGDNDAHSLGVNVAAVRLEAFAVAAFVTSVAVSLSGLIGFIGLIVPHGVRLLWGPDHRQLLPICAINGAIFLIICDTFARTIIAPAQLPVGVITAITGGPFFILLLIKHSKKVTMGAK